MIGDILGRVKKKRHFFLHITPEAESIAGGRIAEARLENTWGPEGCGQDVRN